MERGRKGKGGGGAKKKRTSCTRKPIASPRTQGRPQAQGRAHATGRARIGPRACEDARTRSQLDASLRSMTPLHLGERSDSK